MKKYIDAQYGGPDKGASASKPSLLFRFGYGTNGLSAQTGPRNNPTNPIEHPFTLFSGAPFNTMTKFDNTSILSFEQLNSIDADGNISRPGHGRS